MGSNSVWTLWSRENSLSFARNQILADVSRLHMLTLYFILLYNGRNINTVIFIYKLFLPPAVLFYNIHTFKFSER
jgi:hypothetical protein